jgi:deazaflavin-dependent oxidoreductase (nitroreductase family)
MNTFNDAVLDDPIDTPVGWANDHVKRYLSSDGRDGHDWRGAPTLLLTTVGRRSGKARRTPLIYGRHGRDYLIVGSKGGADTPPMWLTNLLAQPRTRIQVGAEVIDTKARLATAEEKPELWKLMTSIWPDYDGYQSRTTREIPIVVLEPVQV